MISVSNLRKFYDSVPAVDDVTFEIKQGEIVGLLGPNGAGKTTTMRIITGYLPPSSGTVSVSHFDVFEYPLEAKSKLGYLPEHTPLYQDMTVSEYLHFVEELRQISKTAKTRRVKEIAAQVGLSEHLHREIGNLSKGYKQRVGLAQAMIHDPEVLVLDEPTSGLDPNQTMEIRSLIKTLGRKKTILFSTHILSEAEATCDRILIINKGKIVASGTSETLRQQHHGKTLIRLKVEGQAEGLRKVLDEIPGVERVMRLDQEEPGFTVFEIETGLDLRKELTQKVVTAGFALVEIKKESKSLEDVFAALTNP